MKNPAIENELLENINKLDVDQKSDVLHYIKRLSGLKDSKENYRRSAIRQIKNALKGSLLI